MRSICLFLLFAAVSITACNTYQEPQEISTLFNQELAPFYHGVASGDPQTDRVIIWTRVTPESNEPVNVGWRVSESENFDSIVREGEYSASYEKDFTVKIDVDGLEPGRQYFYQFTLGEKKSIIGKTKTIATTDIDSLKFAVVSCANYEFGYFNTYEMIANRQDLDAVLHLGDYIYEYASGRYGDTTQFKRRNYPNKELIELDDYRKRYSQYRLDEDLRKVHQNHPFITIWDDHEIANNSYTTGAENHQDSLEGSYAIRSNAAKQAYYEWLPVREGKMYRSFEYGDLAKVIMLEERLEGRTTIPDSLNDPQRTAENHSMLGEMQMAWLQKELADSTTSWKLIGNQVIFSYLNWGWPNFKINLDAWDGYPAERAALSSFITDNEVSNVVFVTGDTHSSWAFEVTDDPFNNYDSITGKGAIAVEFGTTSINSSNSDEGNPLDTVLAHEKKIMSNDMNPHMKFTNLHDHGYLLITLFEDQARAQWYYMQDLSVPSTIEKLGNEMYVDLGTTRLYSK